MKKTLAVLAIIGFFGFFMALELAYAYGWNTYKTTLEQPIPYSHRIHAGKLNLECTSCHVYAEKSRHATVPSLQRCMECHKDVQKQSPYLDKLKKHWEEKKPIQWAQIHNLPDFIYFSHKRHMKAGLECADCHGKVEWMETMRKVSSLKMGWCVACHKAKKAPLDCWTCHK